MLWNYLEMVRGGLCCCLYDAHTEHTHRVHHVCPTLGTRHTDHAGARAAATALVSQLRGQLERVVHDWQQHATQQLAAIKVVILGCFMLCVFVY